jgi:hypothetical protein
MKLPVFLATLSLAVLPLCAADSAEALIKTLASVGREGEGNERASAAWKAAVALGPGAISAVLSQTGTGSPVADNWLRLAGNAIVDQSLKSGKSLPLADLEGFVKKTSNSEAARILAFDLLRQADSSRAETLQRTLVNDPVQPLRRGAVAHLITTAAALKGDAAKKAYLSALDAVRDEDQTKIVADELKKLGSDVNLPRHFGFLTQWNVIGPFDNTDRAGFEKVYPPETEIVLSKTYDGKEKQVKWQPFESTDDYGKLDFNKPLTALKQSTAYAYTTFDSASEREAELRLGCKNAWKVWLNGKLLFARDEYHRGQRMDQYKLKCHLRKGSNEILVKCCQNEQTESWTVEWEFQLRVCDSGGTAILSAKSDPNASR